MIRRIPIRPLLILSFLLSGLIPTSIVSYVGFSVARRELKEQAFRQLESIRNIKKDQISKYFRERTADVSVLVSDPFVAEAYKHLSRAFREAGGAEGGQLRAQAAGAFEAPSTYRAVHDRYLPFFQRFISEYGYYDFFFLEPIEGETVFTVRKESDFGIRLSAVPSSLRDVWGQVLRDGGVSLSDTQPYPPSGNAPAQFLAAPIREGKQIIGIVALQISKASIDEIMRERSGMWSTGEVYLVGPDRKMRSDSHRDPRNHSVDASFRGTIAMNGVDTEASRDALLGRTGKRVLLNYAGHRVLSAYTPIDVQGVRWALIAEIEEREIDDQVAGALKTKILTLFALTALIVTALAIVVSVLISRGLRHIVLQLERMIDDALKGRALTKADNAPVGADFQGVVNQTNALIRVFIHELEEKRRMEEHIQHAQRLDAIGTLAGGIAHDFNNILTSMFAYAHIIKTQLPEDDAARENLEQLVSAIERGSGLVRQILTFCRQVKTEREPVEVNALINETVKLLRATLPKNIVVETAASPVDAWIEANPSEVHQILMNLCTNSYHALQPQGGSIRIAADRVDLDDGEVAHLRAGPYCRLTVVDNGRGMDAETRNHIFEPFFTTKPPGQGTGMGLAVVHGIVLHHSGAIRVESQPGKGAAFDVFLPLIVEEGCGEALPEAEEPQSAGAGHMLFVDDDEDICASEKTIIESLGYRVTAFTDSRESEAAFVRAPLDFDLVVTDLNMPGISGIELAERLLRIRPDIPIVLTTGFNELVDPEKVQTIGIREILIKPYRQGELVRMVARLLRPAHRS